MSRKKKTISIIAAIVIIAAIGIGATLAYLTDTAGEVTNTFTIGNVNIDINEHEVDEDGKIVDPDTLTKENNYDLIPGDIVDKDPFVTVQANSVKSVVFIQLKGLDSFLATEPGMLEVIGFDTTNWTKMPDSSTGYDGVYVYNNPVDTSVDDQDLPALFTGISYSLEGQGDIELNDIQLRAAAVQHDNLTTSTDWDDITVAAHAALTDYFNTAW